MKKNRLSVGIIDLSINNIYSVFQSCKKAGFKTEVIDFNKKKLQYDIIILPGVGAFKTGVNFLKKNYIKDKLNNYLEKPNSMLYGICLGMQLLFDKSFEFKKTTGLNLINGEVIKFNNFDYLIVGIGLNTNVVPQNKSFKSTSLKNILNKSVNNKKILKNIIIAYEKFLMAKNKLSFSDLKRKYK